jgi:uracil-DNA glycosylase
MSKEENYQALVQSRKSCHICNGLTNPADCAEGAFDSEHIGPWTRWQGNLNTKLMVIGQDWGDIRYFINNSGIESPMNPTNRNLITRLTSIGINLEPLPKYSGFCGEVFLTNAILCLKEGGMQGSVKQEWFENCGTRHLKPTIEMVKPKVLISLGTKVYEAIQGLYNLPRMRFKDAVENKTGVVILNELIYFPMYHCGSRIMNTHRSLEQQIGDWSKVKSALNDGA